MIDTIKNKEYYLTVFFIQKKDNLRRVPEFSHEDPGAIEVTASAALLSPVVAREQMLGTQLHVLDAFAHDRESVGRDVGRGHGPGRAAPSLIVDPGYVARPTRPGVELPWQCVRVVNASHRVHLVYLCKKGYNFKRNVPRAFL